jgi:hypothetical protein
VRAVDRAAGRRSAIFCTTVRERFLYEQEVVANCACPRNDLSKDVAYLSTGQGSEASQPLDQALPLPRPSRNEFRFAGLAAEALAEMVMRNEAELAAALSAAV